MALLVVGVKSVAQDTLISAIMPSMKKVAPGDIFERLTVIKSAKPWRTKTKRHPKGQPFKRWECLCSCGAETISFEQGLRSGKTKSCGCLKRDKAAKDGIPRKGARSKVHSLSSEYAIWRAMIRRCHNANDERYDDWGGRGIVVCWRWRYGDGDNTGVECFVSDMGKRPSKSHSIDRIDNDGDYKPGNCRWATRSQQMANSRKRGSGSKAYRYRSHP